MESLYLLIPLSLLFLVLVIGALYWAVQSGQYDDLDREGERILFEDNSAVAPNRVTPESGSSTSGAETEEKR